MVVVDEGTFPAAVDVRTWVAEEEVAATEEVVVVAATAAEEVVATAAEVEEEVEEEEGVAVGVEVVAGDTIDKQ